MQMGRTHFQVSGLSRREPGSGIRVRVQVQVLNFAPYPYLYLITRTRDLRAETWDPKMSPTFALRTARGAVPTSSSSSSLR